MDVGDIPLLRKLTFRQDQPLLLPELEHIALEYSRNNLQPYPGCVDVLKELVLSRWKEPTTSREGTIVSEVEPTERMSIGSDACERPGGCRWNIPWDWIAEVEKEGIIVNRLACGT